MPYHREFSDLLWFLLEAVIRHYAGYNERMVDHDKLALMTCTKEKDHLKIDNITLNREYTTDGL